MSVEVFYLEHYRDIRKRLMGKMTKDKPKQDHTIPVKLKEDEWWETDLQKRYNKQQELEARKAAAIKRAIDKFGHTPRTGNIQIIRDIARKHGLSYADIIGPDRRQKVVMARHEAIHAVKKACPTKSLPELGRMFGGRDHTTILHALKKPCTSVYYNIKKRDDLMPDWEKLAYGDEAAQ